MIRKFYLRLLGYRELQPHPLKPLAINLNDAKRNYLQLQIAKHRDLEQARLERESRNAATAMQVAKVVEENGVEERLSSVITEFEMAVDRVMYKHGLA
jgi:hypothetical protein